MTKFILRWTINAIALFLAVYFVPGINLESGWTSIIWLALIFGLVNAFLRPLLKLLTCPLIILTLGLFTLIINTILFYVTDWIGSFFGVGITIHNFWAAFLGALIVSVVSIVLTFLVRDELDDRRKDR